MFQKSKILKFLGVLLIACLAIPMQARGLFIGDLFSNWVPQVEDAYQQILNVNTTRWYDNYAEIWCSTSDNITITANLVYDEVSDYATEYLLFFSPYRLDNIKNGDSFVDQSKIIMKKFFMQDSDTKVLFTLSSEDLDMNQDYYGFIVPLDIYDLIWTPTKEIYFNMSNNICSYDNDFKFVTLKPWLNTFSTPAILKSVQFSNWWNNITFAKMEKGKWSPITLNNNNINVTIKPLDWYLIRNSNIIDVVMKIEYDTDNSNLLLLSKDLDAGWNFLWITKTNNPFGDIANATATMILDLTNGWNTNLIQLWKTFLQATKFMLWKAYAVFVNSQWTYGWINNYWDDNSCKGMDEANIQHTFNNWVITLYWDIVDWDKVQIAVFDPNDEYWKSLGAVDMDAGQYSYTTTWEWEHNFMFTNWCKETRYKVNANTSHTYSQELTEAYERAYENWIISESPIDNANLYNALTNSSMEAILLNFATYLWLDSDSVATLFGDLFVDEESYVNRANFGTALSRILWQNQYEWWNPYYYSYHLNALKSAWIITQIDNPTEIIEIKWYVLLTLMRASEIFIPERVNCDDPIVIVACILEESSGVYEQCPVACRIDCDDPLVVLACSDAENYEECPQVCRSNNHIYSEELTEAYNWAYSKSIVTDPTIDDANLYDSITRAELAKMLANWAKDLWMTPDTSLACDFTDTASVKWDLYTAIVEACQLGLMGQGATAFRPYDTVSKAEYFAILSRALWWTQYEGGNPYYINHMNALKAAGIINQTNNPEDALTIKWYVLITLKRASNSNTIDCDDPVVVLACSDPENYGECPQVCREK